MWACLLDFKPFARLITNHNADGRTLCGGNIRTLQVSYFRQHVYTY